MSERRSTEIKFRTTPSFKARVQAASAAADKSMSEYIEECAETRMKAGLGLVFPQISPQPDPDVSTSGEVLANAEEPKGWMFEARQ